MKLLISLTPLLLAGVCASPALGGNPDLKELLSKVNRTAEAVEIVSYEAVAWGEGVLKGHVPRFRATVRMKQGSAGHPPHFRVDGTRQEPKSNDTSTVHVVADDKQAMSLNERTKECTIGSLPEAVVLIAESLRTVCLSRFTDPAPFKHELGADSLEYEGKKSISGTECHVIHVIYAEDEGEARWYFGIEDFLPHRVDRIFRAGTREGIHVLELSDIDTTPEFDEGTFATAVPKGYAEVKYEPPAKRPPPRGLLAAGSKAPDWTLETPTGEVVSLSKLRGKVVVLDFWAIWCTPCVRAMPAVQKLHERFKGKPLAVFGISTWERKRADPVAFMKKKKLTYGLLLKGDQVAQAYGIQGIPTFYVIGPDGTILHASSGFDPSGEAKLAKLIETALSQID